MLTCDNHNNSDIEFMDTDTESLQIEQRVLKEIFNKNSEEAASQVHTIHTPSITITSRHDDNSCK